MNYKKIYDNLIEFRKNTPAIGYSEKHHILPRSLGGSDDPENLVRLSAREHLVAHLLLTKIYNEGPNHYKMVRAVFMMLCQSSNQERHSPSRMYEKLRRDLSEMMSKSQTGNGNSQFGTAWVFHEMVGPRKVDRMLVPEYIEQGWFSGRTLKLCKIKTPKVRLRTEKEKVLTQEQIKERIRKKHFMFRKTSGYRRAKSIKLYKEFKDSNLSLRKFAESKNIVAMTLSKWFNEFIPEYDIVARKPANTQF